MNREVRESITAKLAALMAAPEPEPTDPRPIDVIGQEHVDAAIQRGDYFEAVRLADSFGLERPPRPAPINQGSTGSVVAPDDLEQQRQQAVERGDVDAARRLDRDLLTAKTAALLANKRNDQGGPR